MNLAAIMTLNAGGFLGPLSSVRGMVGSAIGQIAAIGGVSLSAAGAIVGLKKAIDLGSELQHLSAQTGGAVKDIALLQQAFINAGLGGSEAAPVLNLLQRALSGVNESGQPTKKIFDQLGLSITELKKLDAPGQFAVIADRIRRIKDPTEQVNAAMEIFGRTGAKLLAVIKDDSAMQTAAKVLGTQAEVLQRNAGQFDKASTILAAAPVKLRGFFVGAAESISASLMSELEKINDMDFTQLGQRVGKSIAPLIEILKSGQIGDLLAVSLIGAVEIYLAMFLDATINSAKTVWAVLRAPFEVIAKNFATGLGNVWLSAKIAMKELLVMAMDYASLLHGGNGAPASLQQSLAQDKVTQRRNQREQERDNTGFVDSVIRQAVGNLANMDLTDFAGDSRQALKKKLEEIWQDAVKAADANLTKAQATTAATAAKSGGDISAAGTIKARDTEGDRLAKIGLFVGGAGGPALDYARRTAVGVEKLASIIKSVRLDAHTPTLQSAFI
ncbi:hypothetical protein [Geminisphaera colitermitum]|uniref:hypothetical protein n=1 Tax=Geminisphaera colitermitum TaxID=1148786 RepID=UPI000158CAD0|nr:hypothetical protein [Geminisphaera colitermitum]